MMFDVHGTCRGNTYSNCPFSSQPYQFTKGYPKISKCILLWIYWLSTLLTHMHSNPTIPSLGLWDTGNTYQGWPSHGVKRNTYTPWVWDGNKEYNSLYVYIYYIYIFILCVKNIGRSNLSCEGHCHCLINDLDFGFEIYWVVSGSSIDFGFEI